MYMPTKTERDTKVAANTVESYVDPATFEYIVYCWGSDETFRGDKAKEVMQAYLDTLPKCEKCGKIL